MINKIRKAILTDARAAVIFRLRTRYEYMKVVPAIGIFNTSCFRNCVQYLHDNPSANAEIVECMFVDANYPILHYVVLVGGDYLEVTNGWEAKLYEYYYIRKINPLDYDRISSEFSRSQQSWLDEFIPRWKQRLFSITSLL